MNHAVFGAKPHVIALHCSGADGGQWRRLRDRLGEDYGFTAPGLYGSVSAGPWTGERDFTLAEDAWLVDDLVEEIVGPVHLVGHSCGGGVALKVAAERPGRIASLTLYEPSAFHLLKEMGRPGAAALDEIHAVARASAEGLVGGNYRRAAASFVDYWNGFGAWDKLRPEVQAALIQGVPQIPLDFRALIDERTPSSAYQAVTCPVLILQGEHALRPSRMIAGKLAETFADCRYAIVDGAGHMGPFSHAGAVNALIAEHIEGTDRARQPVRASQSMETVT